MKIAVSATGGSINAKVEERFGRAPYYVIIDSETMHFGLVSNPSVTSAHGAGPQTASLLAERDVQVVLTGRVGPNARQALEGLGVKVVENVSGTVKEAATRYLATNSNQGV
jgi:predicted Fe-Mo cluster-binding NifX family protein